MIAATAAARLAASPRGRAAILGAALLAAALLALSPGGVAPVAARAALAAASVAGAAVLLRRSRRPAAAAPLAIVAREPLAGGAGLALVEAGRRRLLVGFGRDGVRLVADLGASEGDHP